MRLRRFLFLKLVLFHVVVTGGLRPIWRKPAIHKPELGYYSGTNPVKQLRQASSFLRGTNRDKNRSLSDGNHERKLQEGRCRLSSAGNFGNLDNQALYFVSFFYQAVFVSGTTDIEISDDFLPFLERSITQGILPGLFECPETNPKGPVVGVSMSLADTITSSGKFGDGFSK